MELDQSTWEQVENLTLKISMRHAPSFPVELLAIINSGQGIDDKVMGSSFSCYPNPFGQSTAFYIKAVKQERAKLSLYQHTGKLLTILYDGIIHPGEQTIIWSDVLLPAGVYYYIYETETDRKTGKAIKLW